MQGYEEMQGYIDECIALASDNAADSSAYLKTLAYFLYIRKCHDSAASAFMAAAEMENNMTDKASETAWSAWQKFKKAKDRLSEDERAYCCKYVIMMFNKIESSYPNPDELAEAEKEAYLILKPIIFRQTDLDDPTFIKMLIPLAIKASDAHTAEKLISMTDDSGDAIRQRMIVRMISPDERERKQAISEYIRCAATICNNYISFAAEQEVEILERYSLLETVISQCRETADTDSLFLMWHISVLKKDAELQAWCENRLKDIAAKDKNMDILAVYAVQAEKYGMDENGPGMVSLFEDWLGNPAFELENVIRCIKTMLPIKKTLKNPEKETIFRYIGHAAQHAENPHEYISRIADAVAAMEFDEDNESALYGITDILCRLHGRFGIQEGKASNMSGLLTLLSRTSEIAANSPEWMRPNELSKIYDIYRIIGTNPPPDIIKARLRKSADQPARLDNSFPDILEHELENGYEPDMEACVLAIGFYMSTSSHLF